MADSQHPDWNYRCNLWRAGLGPDPGPPPDPQHPAVPFEQAVDLLTGEPRPLQPQHPDIAALAVETVSGWIAARNVNRVFDADLQDLRQRVEAALRTLARPVEDEEVREMVEFYRDSASMRRTNGGHPPFIERDENTASLLASLAREKASAEQEIARLRKFLRTALAVVDESGNATADQIGILQEAERALAAAAGAEEPR